MFGVRLAFASCCLVAALGATQAPSDAPMDIRADSFELFMDERRTEYIGNVVAAQGGYDLRADKLVAHFNANNEITRVEAFGNPAVLTDASGPQTTTLRGASIEYDLQRDQVRALGDTEFSRGDDTMTAHELTYDLAEERVVAFKGETTQVRVVMSRASVEGNSGVQ